MEIGEIVHILVGIIDTEFCPFCTDPDNAKTYKTYKGEENSSTILRAIMNQPSRLTKKQKNARPKDGKGRFQAEDPKSPNPKPIFEEHTILFPGLSGPIGAYGNEAHHCISGNECMKGEGIEDVIKNDGSTYEKETGYSINNCANGVYLPSWGRRRWGKNKPDGPWKDLDDDLKYKIIKLPMKANKGQAHIGCHEGKTTPSNPIDYPQFVKKRLKEIKDRVELRYEDCPYCKENEEPKCPAPPPYGVNQWLDALSREISGHLKGHPICWEYFVSEYAARYHLEVYSQTHSVPGIPENWG